MRTFIFSTIVKVFHSCMFTQTYLNLCQANALVVQDWTIFNNQTTNSKLETCR